MLENKNMPKFGPLQGVKVLHASASLAGPYAAQLMADFGADVTWIENTDIPDISRYGTALVVSHERRNQRNISINLAKGEGKDVFLEMLKDVDIFIETSKAGQYTKWGLTDEVMWGVNPKLVILHISGFGQDGLPEYTNRPSFDPIAQAFSGFMNVNGFEDRPPVTVVPFIADCMTGLYGVFSILAALHRAKNTGEGESIDLAQYEIMVRSQVYMADYRTNGITYKREGSKSAAYAGWGTYECKDGNNVFAVIIGGGVIKRAAEFFGFEYGTEIIPKGCSITIAGTPAGILLEEKLAAYFSSRTAFEAEAECVAQGLPVSKINTYEDIVNNPHVKARGIFADWEDFKGKTIKGVGAVPKMKNNPGRVWRPAPEQGMDNEEILAEIGLTEEQISELYEKGIIKKSELDLNRQ